jgi:hypothetical protein
MFYLMPFLPLTSMEDIYALILTYWSHAQKIVLINLLKCLDWKTKSTVSFKAIRTAPVSVYDKLEVQ